MILMRILPGVLKELVKHVPTVLFQVVEWHELAAEVPKLSRRILQKEGYEPLFNIQKPSLAPFGIEMTPELLNNTAYAVTKESAEKCLYLYFRQLFSTQGIFLDLRSQNFAANHTNLRWHPSGIWTQFSPDFQAGLLEVYEGFYQEDEAKYFSGLKRIGLIAEDWNASDKNELGNLFKAQFGSSLTSNIVFNLDDLKNSIIKLSHFLLKKKVKITNNFLYLGIYLVTLYSHLEQNREALPVKEIYFNVRNSLKS